MFDFVMFKIKINMFTLLEILMLDKYFFKESFHYNKDDCFFKEYLI